MSHTQRVRLLTRPLWAHSVQLSRLRTSRESMRGYACGKCSAWPHPITASDLEWIGVTQRVEAIQKLILITNNNCFQKNATYRNHNGASAIGQGGHGDGGEEEERDEHMQKRKFSSLEQYSESVA